MINKLVLDNFKLHAHTELNVAPLTILTGMNGMGKSSIIQALLLLRQSFKGGLLSDGLNLKGLLCDVGTAGDANCQSSLSNQLKMTLSFDDEKEFFFCFDYPKQEMDTFLSRHSDAEIDTASLAKYSLFNRSFQYLSAFRLGPQKSYGRDTAVVKQDFQISHEKGKCEYTVHFLDEYKNEPVLEELCHDPSHSPADRLLSEQVQKWMREISTNVIIKISPTGQDLNLNYKFEVPGDLPTQEMSALNTGFGISYALPILVALLSAKKGSLIIIENPEAHIHPHGQAVLMTLIAKAARVGIQIVLETHSDHIVNGALVAVNKHVIKNTDLSVVYYEREALQHVSTNNELTITEDGRVRNAPKGFFDQIDIDMASIMGF